MGSERATVTQRPQNNASPFFQMLSVRNCYGETFLKSPTSRQISDQRQWRVCPIIFVFPPIAADAPTLLDPLLIPRASAGPTLSMSRTLQNEQTSGSSTTKVKPCRFVNSALRELMDYPTEITLLLTKEKNRILLPIIIPLPSPQVCIHRKTIR